MDSREPDGGDEAGSHDRDRPRVDYGSNLAHSQLNEEDISGHHREKWQDQAVYIGLRYPKDRNKRRRQRHSKKTDKLKDVIEPIKQPSPLPSERVLTLLGEREEAADDDDDERRVTHDVFCEMEELRDVPGEDGNRKEWKETARWIKFEEDVEEGGERWSKPHVATLSLHSLFELRKGLISGTVMLEVEACNIAQVTEIVVNQIATDNQLDVEARDAILKILSLRHHHQHQKKEGHHGKGILSAVGSSADFGRKSSDKKLENMKVDSSSKVSHCSSSLGLKPSSKDLTLQDATSLSSFSEINNSTRKYNEHFLKKIPEGAEAANILVGEVSCLTNQVMAFVRMSNGIVLDDLTEVYLKTRFIFILLGPPTEHLRYHEIGRSIATLMTDEIFHEVAYKSHDRDDLLCGIDEFLDCVTVLPPGEWDPNIRLDPPKSGTQSQEKRKKPVEMQKVMSVNGMSAIVEEAKPSEEEQHGDKTLVRTGRLFGGLIADLKRKAPWYLSDFKDALHVQCLASFFFMYFACLTPIITFGGLLGAATGNNIAAMESLVSGAICGVTYHLFAGQPLTVVGSTGPVLVFESIVYKFCTDQGIHYMCFRFWIGMWMCLFLLIVVTFDLSALVRYITRFTEESFAMLIVVIFIYEAFTKLFHILDDNPVKLHRDHTREYNCSCIWPTSSWKNGSSPDNDTDIWSYATTTQYTSLADENLNSTSSVAIRRWNRKVCLEHRGVPVGSDCNYVSDVFFFSCLLFIATFFLALSLKSFRNTRFFPNHVRVLISDFAVFSAIVIMVVVDYLVSLDTPKLLVPPEFRPTLAARGWIVNPFANKWYWVFASIPPSLLAVILIFMDQQITAVIVNRKENKLVIAICSLVGTPWFVAATVLSINHIRSLTRESESSAPGERPKFLGVREQRVTGTVVFIMVGLSALMANVLKFIPMPVLYGVFLYMGVSSLKGMQFVERVMLVFMPVKYQPDYMFLRHVRLYRVNLFTFIQLLCFIGLWVIKQVKVISIVFPLMVLAMCFIRKGLEWVFSAHELKWLDDIMPDSHNRAKDTKKKKHLDEPDQTTGLTNEVGILSTSSLQSPDSFTGDLPVSSNQLNISEEVANTGRWKQLNSETHNQLVHPPPTIVLSHNDMQHNRPRPGWQEEEPVVKFKIEEDEEDEDTVPPGYENVRLTAAGQNADTQNGRMKQLMGKV